MVGDEDQSIYGFRAAYPDALLNFRNDYKNPNILLMETNYRSNANIVSVSNDFINKNEFRYKKKMKAAREITTDVEIIKVFLTDIKNCKNLIAYFPREKLKSHTFFFSIMIQLNLRLKHRDE